MLERIEKTLRDPLAWGCAFLSAFIPPLLWHLIPLLYQEPARELIRFGSALLGSTIYFGIRNAVDEDDL